MPVKEVECPTCGYEQIIDIDDDTILCEGCGNMWFIEKNIEED